MEISKNIQKEKIKMKKIQAHAANSGYKEKTNLLDTKNEKLCTKTKKKYIQNEKMKHEKIKKS